MQSQGILLKPKLVLCYTIIDYISLSKTLDMMQRSETGR